MSWSSNCGRFFLPAPGSLWVWEMDIPYILFQVFKIYPGVRFQVFRASVWGQAFPESFLPSRLSSFENLATYSVLGEEKSCSEPGPAGGAASLMVLHWIYSQLHWGQYQHSWAWLGFGVAVLWIGLFQGIKKAYSGGRGPAQASSHSMLVDGCRGLLSSFRRLSGRSQSQKGRTDLGGLVLCS